MALFLPVRNLLHSIMVAIVPDYLTLNRHWAILFNIFQILAFWRMFSIPNKCISPWTSER